MPAAPPSTGVAHARTTAAGRARRAPTRAGPRAGGGSPRSRRVGRRRPQGGRHGRRWGAGTRSTAGKARGGPASWKAARHAAPERREAWLAKRVQEGVHVLVCHPRLVQTGLGLVDFPTIARFETNYSVFTMQQASRRSWRIGRSQPVQAVFIACQNTRQADARRSRSSRSEAGGARRARAATLTVLEHPGVLSEGRARLPDHVP